MDTDAHIKQIYANCREIPDQKTEMFSQMLLGQNLSIVDSKGKWKQCRLPDGNICWLPQASLGEGHWEPENPVICGNLSATVWRETKISSEPVISISYGAVLDLLESGDEYSAVLLANEMQGFIRNSDIFSSGSMLADLMRFTDVPYLWGGTTGWGVDCSGLVQLVYSAHGINLPRNASQQAKLGEYVRRSDLAPADLVFFAEKQSIDHVAVHLGEGQLIHAGMSNGCVKIEELSTPYLSENFHSARRVL